MRMEPAAKIGRAAYLFAANNKVSISKIAGRETPVKKNCPWATLGGKSNVAMFLCLPVLPLCHKSGNLWTFDFSRVHTIPIILKLSSFEK